MRNVLTDEDKETIWDLYEAGENITDIGVQLGRAMQTILGFITRSGGKRPPEPTVWSSKRMSLEDREDVSRGLACGDSLRTIAKKLKRSPSTISREVKANGGRYAYRAVVGEASVRRRAKRPKKRRLECDQELKKAVEEGLDEFWSPTQISNKLIVDHPDNTDMRVSPETIYEALYLGIVDSKAKECLRTRRPRRKPRHRRKAVGAGVIRNRRNIKERPAHIEDRTEVGHWEGDLVIGNRSTALATLVERKTRYTVLLQLPGARTMEALNDAIKAVFAGLASELVRTLTWDQGKEIAGHEALAAATGLDVFVCDRSSPWQRGTNENTNGLLRQWWPRSTNFYTLDPTEIARVQTSLNARPRQTLNWQTPTEALQHAN